MVMAGRVNDANSREALMRSKHWRVGGHRAKMYTLIMTVIYIYRYTTCLYALCMQFFPFARAIVADWRWRDRKEAFAEWKQSNAKLTLLCVVALLVILSTSLVTHGHSWSFMIIHCHIIRSEVLVGDEKSDSAGPVRKSGFCQHQLRSTSTLDMHSAS